MNMKKFLAASLAAVMVLGCAACGGSDDAASSGAANAAEMPVAADTVVMTVGGAEIAAETYGAFLNNARLEWSMYLSQYGMDESSYIEQFGEELYSEDLRMRAENYMVLYEVLSGKMEEYDLELADEDLAMSALYESMGMDESYAELQAMLAKVTEHLLGEGGELRPADAELLNYLHDNYLRCKHVLINTVDDAGNDLENQDELEATANDIADRAQAGEDFDALIEEYNEDPGMAGNPEGYVFTEGTMVTEFYEGTKALAENAVSEPVKSSYGWHIIQRLPIRDTDLDKVESEIIEKLVDFDGLLEGWAGSVEVDVKGDAEKITYENCAAYLSADK